MIDGGGDGNGCNLVLICERDMDQQEEMNRKQRPESELPTLQTPLYVEGTPWRLSALNMNRCGAVVLAYISSPRLALGCHTDVQESLARYHLTQAAERLVRWIVHNSSAPQIQVKVLSDSRYVSS